MAGMCGVSVPARPPRRIRAAIRALGSAEDAAHLRAEQELSAERLHAAPLLRQAARTPATGARAVRAAILLHRLQEKEGAEMLKRMARDQSVRTGPCRDLLKRAVHDIVGAEHYIRQTAAAIMHLEQRPESFKAIARFRQISEVLRFLETPLPTDLLRRALVVRTVGGENLSLVRAVLQDGLDAIIEHVCLVRREAARSLVHLHDRQTAYGLLSANLAHPNPAVQLTAMYGLESLGDGRAVGALHTIARDADSPVRADARRLIYLLDRGTPDALTLLRAASGIDAFPATLLRPTLRSNEDPSESLLRPDKIGSRRWR